MGYRVWEDEQEYLAHHEIEPEYDEDSEEYFKLIPSGVNTLLEEIKSKYIIRRSIIEETNDKEQGLSIDQCEGIECYTK